MTVSPPSFNWDRLKDFAAVARADGRLDMAIQLLSIAEEYEDLAEMFDALNDSMSMGFNDLFPNWPER